MIEAPSGMAQAFAILRFQNTLAEREGPDLEETYRRVIDVLPTALRHASLVYPRAETEFAAILDRIDRGEDVRI